ncbi:MAG: LysR family transcriptional regulator [Myxococcales bacterium]|nr:LysR family transcriptional regulator [Myxococcales bacterium]
MNEAYERDLDLNLLRVFVVVADAGTVTEGARRLYLTQPAVSAALRRLREAVGAPLFVRSGRGLALSTRGLRLLEGVRPHLEALVAATRAPPAFDPRTSDRILRLGLSDANEFWLLPRLLRVLEARAPRMRLVVVPVQFRTIGEALASARVDLAVTVADDLPVGTRRRPLFVGSFVCLFDPRHADLGVRPTLARYLAHDHVIVSYNGDLRGIVEDLLGVERRVRVSVPSFQSIGAVVEGTALVATLPAMVARDIVAMHPRLRVAKKPFTLAGTAVELLTRAAVDDDDAVRFVRECIAELSPEGRSPVAPTSGGTRGRAAPAGSRRRASRRST